MSKNFSFKSSVLNHLSKAKETCDRSIGNTPTSDETVKQAARETEFNHSKNLKEIDRQRGRFFTKLFSSRNNLRKDTGVRVIHPVGADVFRELISTYLDIAEIEQENDPDGLPITDEQFYFRYYRVAFNNEVLRKGVFGVAAAYLGVIRRLPTDVIKNISAYVRGISPASNTEHYNFKNAQDFDQEITKHKLNSYSRFGKTERFQLEKVEEVFPTTIRKLLKKTTDEVIKLEKVNDPNEDSIYKILGLIGPYEAESLDDQDIPDQAFSFNPIKALIFSGKNPVDERDIEMKRVKTLLNKKTGEKIIKNQSVRYEDMENNHLHSPLIGSTGLPSWNTVDTISEALIKSIENEQLDRSWHFQSGKVGDLIVNIDGRQYRTLENTDEQQSSFQIPIDTRIISVYGKLKNFTDYGILLPLGSLLTDITEIKSGTVWESESKLPNNFHLKLKLTPELDKENQLQSLNLSVNYHPNHECEYHSWLRNQMAKYRSYVNSGFRNLISPKPFPNPVAAYFKGMENLGMLESSSFLKKVLQNTLVLASLIFIIAVAINLVANAFGVTGTRLNIVSVSIPFFLVGGGLLGVHLNRGNGLNSIIGVTTGLCFLGGILFFALVSSRFINQTLKSAIVYSISPTSSAKPVDKIAYIDKTPSQYSSVIQKVTNNSYPVTSEKDNKKVIWIVTPVIATQTIKGNIKNPKSSNPRSFTAREINPLDLKSGATINALADHITKDNKKTDDTNSTEENKEELKSLGATVISISKESDNEGVVLVRFRFDKLIFVDGQEINLPKGQDTIIAMDTKNTNQIIRLNVSNLAFPLASK